MILSVFVFSLSCALLGGAAQVAEQKLSSYVHQESGIVVAKVGDEVTLKCFYNDFARFYWYKQALGQTPTLISSFYKFDRNGTFYNEFKNNPRFTLDSGSGKNHLTITDLRASDSATYYCASSYTFIFEFSRGTFLSVGDSGLNVQDSVHQSSFENLMTEGSVTLNCTVRTGTCKGDHSVYWFRNSEESHPGVIYIHGHRNDQCERNPNAQTHTCVYNLPRTNVNHAGTYYCAVAACGHIAFGNGTKVDFKDGDDLLFRVYFWSGASAFTTILSVLLTFLVCKMSRSNSSPYRDSQERFPTSSKTNVKGYQNGDYRYYIALRQIRINKSRRPRDNTWSECVYFGGK
ncbi:uncharacterized protein LOC125016136 [Mugil cephalus]|uniref:uncharacterized protein LOC125016136 n=1 Tax=Mugil cephalus TaxID=48193 RepID=UPI001FB60B81|nr:uncharacterized protein LOC125016136 [Mugil cephalus]